MDSSFEYVLGQSRLRASMVHVCWLLSRGRIGAIEELATYLMDSISDRRNTDVGRSIICSLDHENQP